MRRSILPLAAMLAAAPVHATTFCASTSAELQSALTAATGNGQANTIRVTIGTFTSSSAAGFTINVGAFSNTIEGGYLSIGGNCNVPVPDPTLTVIDGQSVRPGLRIGASNSGGVSGSITVRNLTFANGRRLVGSGERGAGLLIESSAGFTGDVLVERNVFRGNTASFQGGGMYVGSDGGIVTVRNNLFVGNTADANSGLSVLGNNSTIYVNNNTFAGNIAASANSQVATLGRSGSSTLFVSNNIFWGNTTATQFDLSASSGTTVLIANDIQRRAGTLQPPSASNVSVDPLFVGANDFRLRDNSPLVDSGATPPIGGLSALDLAGLPRVENGAVDAGAFELDRVFANGFEN